MIKIYLESPFAPEIRWVVDLIARDRQFSWVEVARQDADLLIGHAKDFDIRISNSFFQRIFQKQYSADLHFSAEFIIRNHWGEADLISTIFYLVNGIQEYDYPRSEKDRYGRFQMKGSAQYQFGALQKNYVGELITRFMQAHPVLIGHIPKKERKTRIYLSHDIDYLYGSLYFDGKWALKQLKIGKFLEILSKTILMDPPWFNIDRIMKMHTEYDMRSTFYWIMSHGRDKLGIQNGDYRIGRKNIREQIMRIKEQGFGVGMHKSTLNTSFAEEMERSPVPIHNNRYHFLKFKLPDAWSALEDSGIKLDTSLGFAESIGFRNSYGLPFIPYNLKERKPFSFVELPLNIMDGSFVYYQNVKDASVFKSVRDFIEKNKTSAIINILWHNNELSDYFYRDMFKNYKNLLAYLYEEQFQTVLAVDILHDFQHIQENME